MSDKQRISKTAVLSILLLASFWGLIEVSLGPWLRNFAINWKSAILGGMGLGLIGVALGMFRRPLLLLLMPLGAIMIKMLAVPLIGIAPVCKLNNCIGVGLQGYLLVGALLLLNGSLWRTPGRRIVLGAAVPLIAAASFWYIGMRAEPCNYLLSYSVSGGLLKFLGAEGLRWALVAALLFPAGFTLGGRLVEAFQRWEMRRPLLLNTTVAMLMLAVWVASSLAIVNL